jgi:hypothetical protein
MPKNAQGSWVGTQAQPVFQTYQTAGMLQPAAPPTQPVAPPPPTAPAPVVGAQLPPDLIGQIGLLTGNTSHPMPFQPPQTEAMTDPRERLVNAVLGATGGGGRRAANRF